MAFDLQEQEQIDSMKAFWQQWGKLIGGAVLAVSLGYLGYKAYNMYQLQQAEKAAASYEAVDNAVAAKDIAKLKSAALQLQGEYAGTIYASRSALVLAKAAFDKNDLDLAASQLQWVLQNSKDDAVKAIARLRLAALHLDQKKYDAAVSELNQEHPAAFDAQYLELKGDVFVAKGDNAAARDAYKASLAKLTDDDAGRQLVQTKLDALGG
ncbi:tetratricopeptide repeat protein [Chromobacterium sp. IIBBL 290-4]|uniref:YfgM family protein n=1 Tax=Chromobacterium sp. IIBBL 290-4 TaxID=2953890 RepID=UPI0020B78DB7|nr:tetratricopeptide repeat protein [Chromobacterium sp. IIBBL 290-4]UTH72565.1 tetratricopeptide repeat protein [Chromobacterium sp. IIBBL 290-4]